MARVGKDTWEVTCVAPSRYYADHGWADFAELPGEACRSLGVRAYGPRSPPLFAYGPKLRSLLREPWDAVYAWEEPYVLSGWQIAAWSPTRAVFTISTLQNIRKRYPPPFSLFERGVLRRADGWIYCGESAFLALRDKAGYADRPSRLGPLGVDVELFRADPSARRRVREELGWETEGPPVVGYVGRFVPEKGLALLMRTLDRIRSPWRALFIGSGVLEPDLRRWMSRHGDRVRIVSVPHDKVPPYLNAIDLLCAPSQTAKNWREQFGRMLVEAGACGIPVIGSDSGEIPFVIGDAGVVVGEADEDGWMARIAELLESPARRRELGDQALERAHAKYAWPVVARGYLDFLEELLAARRA